MLAKATAYPVGTSTYDTLFDQGFELARRLQDADALDAYRDEEWLQEQAMTRSAMSGMSRSGGPPSIGDMVEMVAKMAQARFGDEMPPELIEPLVMQMMAAAMGEPCPLVGRAISLEGFLYRRLCLEDLRSRMTLVEAFLDRLRRSKRLKRLNGLDGLDRA